MNDGFRRLFGTLFRLNNVASLADKELTKGK